MSGMTAPFVAQYPANLGEPTIPTFDAMLTIAPPPAARVGCALGAGAHDYSRGVHHDVESAKPLNCLGNQCVSKRRDRHITEHHVPY